MNASIKSSVGGILAALRQNAKVAITCVALVNSLLLAGCETTKTANVPYGNPMLASETLAPGDVLRISYTGARQHDLTQKIRPDGRISLPLIGEVRASGKKLATLQSELKGMYASQLQDNEVVVLLDSSAAAVYVTGAVGKPGKVPLDRPMTALEAIMEAGGFDQGLADLKKVVLVRNVAGRQTTQTLDLSPALTQQDSAAFFLKPYDVIYVKERFF